MKRTQMKYETTSFSLKYVCSWSSFNREAEYIFEEMNSNYPNLKAAIILKHRSKKFNESEVPKA